MASLNFNLKNFKGSSGALRHAVPLMFGAHLAIREAAPFDALSATHETFAPHYEEHLKPRIEEFEAKRVAALAGYRGRLFLFCLGAVILVAITILMVPFTVSAGDNSFGLLALPVLGIFGLWIWATSPLRKYRQGVKSDIYPLIFKFFGDDFIYEATSPLTVKSLRPSDIIPSYDNEYTEDYVRGSHDGVGLEMIEAKLTETRGSGKHRHTVTVFRGLAILFAMNKNFAGKTIVKKDAGAIGNWFSDKFQKLETVRLEDPVFENRFEVFSSDQVEARYLLTPAFMERLLELSSLFGNADIRCSFYDDRLLLLLPSSHDRFEAVSAFQPVTFVDEIDTILQEMPLIFEIIDVLKLDRDTRL